MRVCPQWIVRRVWPDMGRAKRCLAEVQANDVRVDRLVADLERHRRTNHFSQKLTEILGGQR